MSTLNEALARDRMREQLESSRRWDLAREVSAARRWHRLSSLARRMERRHSERVDQLAGR